MSAVKPKTPAAADGKNAKGGKPAKSGKAWLPIMIVAIVAAAAAGGGGWYLSQRNATAHEAGATDKPKTAKIPAPAQYFGLEPPFVVNLNGSDSGAQFLQVEVQLMTRDPAALESLKQHAPALRAHLLMLFSQVDANTLSTREGKEKLRSDALGDVRKLMKSETGDESVDDLLFTSFVMQ